MIRTLYWKKNNLYILNQKLLPHTVLYRRCRSYGQVADCIKGMIIRGAPAIGVAAAYGLVLAIRPHASLKTIQKRFNKAKKILARTRPTAVNLFWALEKMNGVFKNALSSSKNIRKNMLSAAHDIYQKDLAANKRIGFYGSKLLKRNSVLLTHCNAGALATVGWGTALGIIRTGFLNGKVKKVFVDETRPFLQGSRLTAFELKQDGIPAELITDNMAGYMMQSEHINGIIVGADRIASNGDTANKIGTYSLAVLAQYHNIPFYVAAPVSTFDGRIASGKQIPIEERPHKEVTHIGPVHCAPHKMPARHPAFDVTPAQLITAIITERGIIHKPNRKKVIKLLRNSRT